MTDKQTPMIAQIIPFLAPAEKFFLAGLTIGAILVFGFQIVPQVMQVSLGGLAIVYFLTAYRVLDVPDSDDEPYGFNELMATTIVPKVMYIGTAFTLFGLLLYSLKTNQQGYTNAMLVGASTVCVSTVLTGYFFFRGVKHLVLLQPIFLRAIPVLLVAGYILYTFRVAGK